MPSHAARIVLVEYARRIRESAGPYCIDQTMYACEASTLEAHRWVSCVRLDDGAAGKEGRIYRVTLTRLGLREAAALEADLGRGQ